jgi:hypothetical protein
MVAPTIADRIDDDRKGVPMRYQAERIQTTIQPLLPPAGAQNVLLLLVDDVSFGG